MKIARVYTPKDIELTRQLDNIISNQEASKKRVTVVFGTADAKKAIDVGFRANRWRVINPSAGMQVYSDASCEAKTDDRWLVLKADATGTAIIEVWRE